MNKKIQPLGPLKNKDNQPHIDALAVALSQLMGASVVPKSDYDKVNSEKKKLLDETLDINKLQKELIYSECKVLGLSAYHRKWKPTTRGFEKRLQKLQKEKLYVDSNNYPKDIAENLKEAFNCYISGLPMACYIMILRTIEIAVSQIYAQHNSPQLDGNGREKFVTIIIKLNWVKQSKMIGGHEYTLAKSLIEARNDSVHEIFTPKPNQIISAFETVITLVNKLKYNI